VINVKEDSDEKDLLDAKVDAYHKEATHIAMCGDAIFNKEDGCLVCEKCGLKYYM